jgi:NSS family neurotransmitter:Na+ symporter
VGNQLNERGVWSSKLGFIMAAAGSAVGLGNIWRFPYMTGMYGGAAFVLVYLGCVFLLGVPIMLNELIVGRRTQRNPVGALEILAPNTSWKFVGGLGVLTGFGILTFYSVIAGWTIGYIVKSIEWGLINPVPAADLPTVFKKFIESPVQTIGYLVIFSLFTMAIVLGGVKNGIERWNKILMPVLFGVLLLLIIRAVTLPGAEKGISFYLKPDFSKINGDILIEALGQAFFSLSLGMGAMITYGSYLNKKDNLVTSGLSVCLFDTMIALMAGLAILPAVFALGQEPTQGPNLIFVVLPIIFMKMPAGAILGPLFFFLLTIAALTSTVSLLEVVTAYFIDEKGWSRKKAVLTIGLSCLVFSILAALSWNISPGLTRLPVIGISFFDLLDLIFAKYSLAIGALLLAVYVGWKYGISAATAEVSEGNPAFARRTLLKLFGQSITLATIWGLLIRFFVPSAIFILILDSAKLQENYAPVAKIVGILLLESLLVGLLVRFIAREKIRVSEAFLVPAIRALGLVILGPVLLLIPVIGTAVFILLAILLNFFLLKFVGKASSNKLWMVLGVLTGLEVFAGLLYFFI